jgi:hypothetical protein
VLDEKSLDAQCVSGSLIREIGVRHGFVREFQALSSRAESPAGGEGPGNFFIGMPAARPAGGFLAGIWRESFPQAARDKPLKRIAELIEVSSIPGPGSSKRSRSAPESRPTTACSALESRRAWCLPDYTPLTRRPRGDMGTSVRCGVRCRHASKSGGLNQTGAFYWGRKKLLQESAQNGIH